MFKALLVSLLAVPAFAAPKNQCTTGMTFPTTQAMDCARQKCYYKGPVKKLKDDSATESRETSAAGLSVLAQSRSDVDGARGYQRQALNTVNGASAPQGCSGCQYCIDYAKERETAFLAAIEDTFRTNEQADAVCKTLQTNPGSNPQPCIDAQLSYLDKELKLVADLKAADAENINVGQCTAGTPSQNMSNARSTMENLAAILSTVRRRQFERFGEEPCKRHECKGLASTGFGALLDASQGVLDANPNTLGAAKTYVTRALAAYDEATAEPKTATEFRDYVSRVTGKRHMVAFELKQLYDVGWNSCR